MTTLISNKVTSWTAVDAHSFRQVDVPSKADDTPCAVATAREVSRRVILAAAIRLTRNTSSLNNPNLNHRTIEPSASRLPFQTKQDEATIQNQSARGSCSTHIVSRTPSGQRISGIQSLQDSLTDAPELSAKSDIAASTFTPDLTDVTSLFSDEDMLAIQLPEPDYSVTLTTSSRVDGVLHPPQLTNTTISDEKQNPRGVKAGLADSLPVSGWSNSRLSTGVASKSYTNSENLAASKPDSCSHTKHSPTARHLTPPPTHEPGSSNRVKPFLRRSQNNRLVEMSLKAIPKLMTSLRIPACFRIAEALRELKHAKFYIELYAILLEFETVPERKLRLYRVADIFFPAQPPFITGFLSFADHDNSNQQGMEKGEAGVLLEADESVSDLGDHNYADRVVRIIVCPGSIGNHSTSSDAGGNPTDCHQLPSVLGDAAHVRIEAIWRSDWSEIDYVRGIVDF